MGRPSLAEQRTREILDAFERCVARHGLEASSLELVAEEAGMKRSILRHYVGNRGQLIVALAERVIQKYQAFFEDHLAASSRLAPIGQLMGYFFPKVSASSPESILVIESLIAEGSRNEVVRRQMQDYVDWLVTRCAELLRIEYPGATKKKCWDVSYGLVCLCFNQESLTPLQLPRKYAKAAKLSAEILIASLDG
ncbi:MAG: TetR/AcrR family transcriptional regulator [Planctomycetota bacterium]